MRTAAISWCLVLCWTTLTVKASADIVLIFEGPQTFIANSGIQPINVFASSSVGGESAVSIGADFVLGGAAVFNAPNAGTFGGAGFLGNGNIVLSPGASTFDRDPTLFNTGNLNINFSAAQVVPSTLTPLATLLVDTTGLAEGNYSITATNGFFGLGTIANAAGSFRISSVPEPASVVLLAVAFGGVVWRRYLRTKNHLMDAR